jgi:transposase
MGQALSIDLRERVVAAVDGGMSRRQAAVHFGVSPSSAIRWVDQQRKQGSLAPKPQGGDHRSGRIEAHADFILALVAERPDITLDEIRAKLAGKGVAVGISTVWRFFGRHRFTLKKSRRMRANASAPT